MLNARIKRVVIVPRSGAPDDNSKTEPTAAIAVTQEQANSNPLLGVNIKF